MRVRIFSLTIAAGLLFSSFAFGQAAVEGALTHGLSSSAGTGLGNALGHATNRLAGRVAQQTSNATARAVASGTRANQATAGPRSSANATSAQPVPGGSMIVSIQGGEKPASREKSAACSATPRAKPSPTTAPTASPAAQSQPAACADSGTSIAAHPSEITVSLPK